ncbi:MAG: hypothetical protein QG602_3936 [Verrucomicrobiota bacterium]|nr:hypothetical protein [Verrucomicrobiota bacterium]
MIEMGLIVGLGLLVTLAKLPWRGKMWVISHPLLMDAIVFVFLIAVHWGTFSGVMVATIGALFCSITLGVAKWLVGHVRGNTYYPGVFNVVRRLM